MKAWLPIALVTLGGCRCGGPVNAAPAAQGWVTLYDGGEPKGWRMAGPGRFVVDGDALKAEGGMGMLWYRERVFGDFLLQLQWRVEEAGDNSGVFVRFPDPGNDPWVAVDQGYEIQINDVGDAPGTTGSVYSFQGATAIPTRAVGEWNDLEVDVTSQRYVISINGQKVNDFTGSRGLAGFIGLQNHDDGSPVRFRRVRVFAR